MLKLNFPLPQTLKGIVLQNLVLSSQDLQAVWGIVVEIVSRVAVYGLIWKQVSM
jgi:hypothetical protein